MDEPSDRPGRAGFLKRAYRAFRAFRVEGLGFKV